MFEGLPSKESLQINHPEILAEIHFLDFIYTWWPLDMSEKILDR